MLLMTCDRCGCRSSLTEYWRLFTISRGLCQSCAYYCTESEIYEMYVMASGELWRIEPSEAEKK